MIYKGLFIIIVFYALGVSFLGIELTLGQWMHIEMVSPLTGEPVKTAISGYMQQQQFNERTEAITSANFTTNSTFYNKVETFTTAAAFVAWELVGLMTGVYIFYIMSLFGVPNWFVVGFIVVYILLLARAIIGYIRGI